MKKQKLPVKEAVILPRRRGLGRKNPIRIAQEAAEQAKSLVLRGVNPPTVTKARVLPNGKLLQSFRAYKEVAAVGGVNDDWAVNALSEDSDIWQNQFLLRQRSRDLFRTDVYFKKYTQELFANVFGYNGYSMRLLIKETEDRTPNSNGERSYLNSQIQRRKRINDFCRSKNPNIRSYDRQYGQIQVGDFDEYAIKLIMDAWKEWQRREYCTMAGRLNYKEVRQVRLLSAARDGDFFIRHIRDPKVNKFGYSQHLINSEWCDFYLNTTIKGGTEIRMGIERDKYGKPQNYYFIKRQPMDWQYAIPGAFNYASAEAHEIIPADEIIHYARYEDGDSTRPAPWSASVIPKSRHLDKYEEAEVVAARLAACKLGFFYSDTISEGGTLVGDNPDPTKSATLEVEPGSFQGLDWGVKFQGWDPTHPNQNFDLFRKGMLRAWCAGLPGANYNIIANDLEGVNYSSGRLGMLDERELWKMVQDFDIDIAEVPTFEAWLECALINGAIPLPIAKYDKFNKPVIRGRRWAWVDPLKEVQASALQVANKFTSRTRVIEDSDVDAEFEDILLELAEEEMMMEQLGMDSTSVVGKVAPAKPAQDVSDVEAKPDDDGNDDQGFSKVLSPEDFERQLQIARAGATVMNITTPPVTLPPVEINVPEQKSVVKFEPRITVPSVKSPDVVVNVAAPNVNVAAPDVKIANQLNVPSTKSIKLLRGDDGKMSGAEFEKE